MNRAEIRYFLRHDAGLASYGSGFRYDWELQRGTITEYGSGAERLYAAAQPGDHAIIDVWTRSPKNGEATQADTLQIDIPTESPYR